MDCQTGIGDGSVLPYLRTASVFTPRWKQARNSGLYRSDDGGDTWTLANSDARLTSRAWYFSDITVDPNNPDVIYIPNVALYRSEDGGKTISIVRGAPGGDDYHQLWIDPKDSSRMIIGTDQGTSISLNDGKTWSSWYNQPIGQFYHVITDNEFPYHVYGAQQDSGAQPSRVEPIMGRLPRATGSWSAEAKADGLRPIPAIRTFFTPPVFMAAWFVGTVAPR